MQTELGSFGMDAERKEGRTAVVHTKLKCQCCELLQKVRSCVRLSGQQVASLDAAVLALMVLLIQAKYG